MTSYRRSQLLTWLLISSAVTLLFLGCAWLGVYLADHTWKATKWELRY